MAETETTEIITEAPPRPEQPAKKENPYLWKPGQSGNPGGIRKKRPLTERYMAICEQEAPAEVIAAMKMPAGSTWGDCIAMAAAREAIQKGGTLARKDMREAMEGKAPQRIEVHDERQKTEIVVTFKRAAIGNPRAIKPGLEITMDANGDQSVLEHVVQEIADKEEVEEQAQAAEEANSNGDRPEGS